MLIGPHFAGRRIPEYTGWIDSVIVTLSLMCCAVSVDAQNNIPLGDWRLHLSYNHIQHIEVGQGKIFAASASGIAVYDLTENALHTYDKLNALTATGISAMVYDAQNNQLLIGYDNGTLDIIRGNMVNTFRRLSDAEVTTSKKINHISIYNNIAYLSTSYGVVAFDLQRLEIKETWRDLGTSGNQLPVFKTAFLKDSIFLASANGVLAGNLQDNLLDFNNWTRFVTTNLSGPIAEIATFNDKVFAAGATGLYRFAGQDWLEEPFAKTETIQSLSASGENIFMIVDSAIHARDVTGNFFQITDLPIRAPTVVQQDPNGNFWIGDKSAGLISNRGGTFSTYLPNGPMLNAVAKMVYYNGSIFVVPGGFSAAGQPLNFPGQLNVFENGSWRTIAMPFADLTDIAFRDGKTFVASFGSGVRVTDASGNSTFLDETNSPLRHSDSAQSRITALAESSYGLWVAIYGGDEPLHLFKPDGTWESFSFLYPNAGHPTRLAVDGKGNVWMALNPAYNGGLVALDYDQHQNYYKTTLSGTGALPDVNVNCLTSDRDGAIWIGTDRGVAYYLSPAEDAVKPIFEGRFLLRDEKITAIAVDAGNRKWIGTETGVWLFNPAGEALVHHFTSENSPLLSNLIRDIEINPTTGEVFFATDKGIISFRSDATRAETGFQKIRIFPNPVRPGYAGTVGIDGLARDAFVRITDLSGKLIWQTQANGGMATWNVRNHEGRRVGTGVYLVFALTQDGSESVVGKIAVIE